MNSFLAGFITVYINIGLLLMKYPATGILLAIIAQAIFYTWLGQWFPTFSDIMFYIGTTLNVTTYFILDYLTVEYR